MQCAQRAVNQMHSDYTPACILPGAGSNTQADDLCFLWENSQRQWWTRKIGNSRKCERNHAWKILSCGPLFIKYWKTLLSRGKIAEHANNETHNSDSSFFAYPSLTIDSVQCLIYTYIGTVILKSFKIIFRIFFKSFFLPPRLPEKENFVTHFSLVFWNLENQGSMIE